MLCPRWLLNLILVYLLTPKKKKKRMRTTRGRRIFDSPANIHGRVI